MENAKCKCGTEVVDGQNGQVYKPHWSDKSYALCYACENRMVQECDMRVLEVYNIRDNMSQPRPSRVGRKY